MLFPHFALAFFSVLCLAIPLPTSAQTGFISIDCGLQANTRYTDERTGLDYISDASFIDGGVTKSIDPEVRKNSGNIDRQLWHLRSFPEGDRNCYKVAVTKGYKYLIRATFMYGNYDGLNQLPAFDLHLGPNQWRSVKIVNTSSPKYREIIHITNSNHIDVCLVNIGSGTPFISALEFRPLNNNTYQTAAGSLRTFMRLDVGSASNQTVRYPHDVYDRLWFPGHFSPNFSDLRTTVPVDSESNDIYRPPSTVMQSAQTTTDPSQPFYFRLINPGSTTHEYYIYLHFAEIVKLGGNQSRQFNFSLDGKPLAGPVIPYYLSATTFYGRFHRDQGQFNFSLFKIGNSTLPPLINAIEFYCVVKLTQSETNQADVDAIMKIKSTYRITRNWQGDPCAPLAHVWEGLNCSYNDTAPPNITSINFFSSGLMGQIAPDIANLKSLQYLDLSNNNLTGPVPDFLSQLPLLKVLNLAGNMLTGTIPAGLFERSENGLLSLRRFSDCFNCLNISIKSSVGGNPNLCPAVSCPKSKKFVVPLIASIATFIVLAVVIAIMLWVCKRQRQQADPLESKKRQFTYSDVMKITNNFESVIGRGGFGAVFHGCLDDFPVAVKMLSETSVQGYKEFHAEVKLLLRVHHRNLTTLVGYCNQGTNAGLIYEYMANGNLKSHLSDNSTNILSWEKRLQIALEAAQGLEYLHHGCRPPIIHRDVKTSNILLNDKFEAKLSDFGLSRNFPAEGCSDACVSTTVAGTPGYLDPEYYVTNGLSEKSDVYSFGVVLSEIITSRPVLAKHREKIHISQWVSSMLENGDAKGIVDPRLCGEFDINSVWKVAELAMACVSEDLTRRPTMNQVVIDLSECVETSRTMESQTTQSKGSIEMTSASVQSDYTLPQAR